MLETLTELIKDKNEKNQTKNSAFRKKHRKFMKKVKNSAKRRKTVVYQRKNNDDYDQQIHGTFQKKYSKYEADDVNDKWIVNYHYDFEKMYEKHQDDKDHSIFESFIWRLLNDDFIFAMKNNVTFNDFKLLMYCLYLHKIAKIETEIPQRILIDNFKKLDLDKRKLILRNIDKCYMLNVMKEYIESRKETTKDDKETFVTSILDAIKKFRGEIIEAIKKYF